MNTNINDVHHGTTQPHVSVDFGLLDDRQEDVRDNKLSVMLLQMRRRLARPPLSYIKTDKRE